MSSSGYIFIGEAVIVIVLLIVHFLKVREMQSVKEEVKKLRKEVEGCKNSFGGYLSLLDKENTRLKMKLSKK